MGTEELPCWSASPSGLSTVAQVVENPLVDLFVRGREDLSMYREEEAVLMVGVEAASSPLEPDREGESGLELLADEMMLLCMLRCDAGAWGEMHYCVHSPMRDEIVKMMRWFEGEAEEKSTHPIPVNLPERGRSDRSVISRCRHTVFSTVLSLGYVLTGSKVQVTGRVGSGHLVYDSCPSSAVCRCLHSPKLELIGGFGHPLALHAKGIHLA